jgi:oxazoline/thiazoline synthase
MFNKPQFKPHFHVEVVEPSTVYLLSEKEHYALEGRLYTQLAPLLNGQHTVEDILDQVKEQASVLGVYLALTRLTSQDYLVEVNTTLSPEIAAFWSSQGVDSHLAAQKLQNTKVAIKAFGAVEAEPFASALKSLEIQVVDLDNDPVGAPIDLTVVLVDDYLQSGLEAFNQEALQRQTPWMIVKPIGTVIWMGPVFSPGETGCWQCLAQRLQGNREVETTVQRQKGMTAPVNTIRALLPTNIQTGINLAATEVAKWVVQGKHEQLDGKVITLDLACLSLQEHILTQRPQCLVCGDPTQHNKPSPIVLTSQKKQFTADGGHRGMSPDQTIQKYEHHISPITGIISALPKYESKSELIHVYGAVHQFGGRLDNLASLRRSLRHKSAGKGKTDLQSKASGLCEALERYSGVFTGDEARIKATYVQLAPNAIHPNACMQFSLTQYQHRQEWNPQHSRFAWVPDPFDQEQEVEWTAVWSLTEEKFKYLPTTFCYFNYPLREGHRFCVDDSNGNAAGNTLEEAILQGFMELVERDCVALWWYNRVQRPTVDLDSFDEPYLRDLQSAYQAQHRDYFVIDITSDLNIPSFAAIAWRTDQEQEQILLGFGTHFDPKIAMLRAVTEMNQTLWLNPETQLDDPDWKNWLESATRENQSYLMPDEHLPPKVCADYPQRWSDDLRQDVLTCVEITAQHGMEMLVLDQTRPDVGLSAVKVIIPGMRHFWARFAPGRLYDVPVRLGWLPAPLSEEQLNPIPMFF